MKKGVAIIVVLVLFTGAVGGACYYAYQNQPKADKQSPRVTEWARLYGYEVGIKLDANILHISRMFSTDYETVAQRLTVLTQKFASTRKPFTFPQLASEFSQRATPEAVVDFKDFTTYSEVWEKGLEVESAPGAGGSASTFAGVAIGEKTKVYTVTPDGRPIYLEHEQVDVAVAGSNATTETAASTPTASQETEEVAAPPEPIPQYRQPDVMSTRHPVREKQMTDTERAILDRHQRDEAAAEEALRISEQRERYYQRTGRMP